MGVDIVLELQALEPDLGGVSDDEVRRYWEQHGAGSALPPDLCEAVRYAIAAARLGPDPAAGPVSRFEDRHGRDRTWWERDLDATARRLGATPLGAFQGRPEDRQWFSAADALRTVRALRPTHPEHAAFLDELGAVLEAAGSRGFRMLAHW